MSESQIVTQSLERVRLNAATCRDLADTALTPTARSVLAGLAERYEEMAISLERQEMERGARSPFRWTLP